MVRACSKNGEDRNAYRILVRNPEGERPLGRTRHRWVDNIKMDLREVRWDRSESGSGPVEGSSGDGNKPSGSIKCWEILE
jgi:hypothetical protein